MSGKTGRNDVIDFYFSFSSIKVVYVIKSHTFFSFLSLQGSSTKVAGKCLIPDQCCQEWLFSAKVAICERWWRGKISEK